MSSTIQVPQITQTYPVTGMSCASCAAKVETVLKANPGIADARVNLATSTVALDYEAETVKLQDLKSALNGAGYDLFIEENEEIAKDELEQKKADELRILKRHTILAALWTLPVMIIGMFFMNMPYANWIMLIFTVPVVFVYGRRFFLSAFQQLKHRSANMYTLVALSTGIAFVFSLFNTIFPEFWTSRGLDAHVYYEAAAAIIAFILFGKFLEENAKSATSSAIKGLIGSQPRTVTKVHPDGQETVVAIQDVIKGDALLVKPGEKIPVDGVVESGSSFIDESMISGEPVPVEVATGKEVFAGTINQKGSFVFIARKVGGETVLAQIVKMVQEAQGSKAPVQKTVDRIASVFVPVVIGLSVLTFFVWMLAGGDNEFAHALLAAVTVLVIACPCALGLATPTAIMVGIGKGAEHHILIKDAESLETAHRVDAIVLDKTGTITEGKPRVTDLTWLVEDERRNLKQILYSIENKSEHPLAGAVVAALTGDNGTQTDADDRITQQDIQHFESLTGQGVAARVRDTKYFVGNLSLVRDHQLDLSPDIAERVQKLEDEAKTVFFFAEARRLLAVIAIADTIKATSTEAIRKLKSQKIEVYMLTGDNPRTARAVAREVGLNDYKAGVMPSEKAEFVQELQARGRTVAMVGDGINDSQALAQADISIAMGKGSDIAIEVAKMALLTSDLGAIPRAIQLSKETVRTIHQNLFWAFIYNLIGIPLAAGILYPFNGFLLNPMIAAAAMAFSSVSVVSNSLRVKWRKLK